jgi:hypothetical protein
VGENALLLLSEAQESPGDASKLVAFLDAVASLKDVDDYSISEQQRLALFYTSFI